MEEQTILVVDDDPATTTLMASQLNKMKLSVDFCIKQFHNAEEALAWCDESGSPPLLIVADVYLPRMSGIQLLEAIRGKDTPCKDIPVLIITGDVKQLDRFFEAMKHKADGFFPKPLNFKKVLSLSKSCAEGFLAKLKREKLMLEMADNLRGGYGGI